MKKIFIILLLIVPAWCLAVDSVIGQVGPLDIAKITIANITLNNFAGFVFETTNSDVIITPDDNINDMEQYLLFYPKGTDTILYINDITHQKQVCGFRVENGNLIYVPSMTLNSNIQCSDGPDLTINEK